MQFKYRNINIELTNACTFSCSYCPDHKMTRKKQMMSLELTKKIINDIAELKITDLINYYVMGEPLLHPKLFEIIKYTKKKGLKVKLNTNGSLLNEKINKKLLTCGIDEMHISYQIPIQELFEIKNCKLPALSFEKWNNSIIDLLKKRKSSRDSITKIHLLFFSYPHLLKIKPKNVRKKGLKNSIENSIRKTFADLNTPLNKKLLNTILHGKLLQRYLIFFKIADGIYFNVMKLHNWGNIKENTIYKAWFGSCEAFRDTCAILSNGDVSLCCADYNGELIVGNLNKTSLKNILQSPKVKYIIKSFQKNRLPFEKCRICRGGPNLFFWMRNQIRSVLSYNFKKKN